MLLKYYQKLDDALSYLFSSVSNEKKLLKTIFGKKKLFYVDVGTNEGNFIEFLFKFLSFRKVICFEPIQELPIKLKNKFNDSNVEIYNYDLSNKDRRQKFYQYEISSQSSIYKQNDTFKSLKNLQKIFKIQTTSFDKKFKNKKIKY